LQSQLCILPHAKKNNTTNTLDANRIGYYDGNTTCLQKQQNQQIKQEVQLP
jgi:hypothetical protein